ncbi:cytosolic protein [Aquibacillus koreensis]|uniref:Cytosolic protein n=1 Tax=Aquibacillus koreensis TaxID=279446 RepID=A0A9X3WHU6_9BACI|nr:cytosolic protein [Aquibacillus koreensis]MCT2537195.1 cytosolic protein [Aquibacillus koreensis]MDC3419233.1 cytosolic protein [Aquibacillus koreensis]
MSIRQQFDKFFNTHSETKENHWDPKLRTHYFKTTKERGFQAVEDFFRRSSKYEIVGMSEQHGEISVNFLGRRKAFVTATIIMVQPFRTAIDLSITTESIVPFDLGYSHKLIPKIYDDLKKELAYIGTSSER